MNERELKNRMTLQQKKPLVFAKISKHPEMIRNKECVAFIPIQYSYACNFKCKHCSIEKFKRNEKTLNLSDVKSIADQADAMGLASICITGGEPLIFPELKELFEAVGSERFNISMDTNGYLLTEEKVKWLIGMGVDRIHLSMDGLEASHDLFRASSGSWKKCIEVIGYCQKHGLGVIVNIVATKSSVNSGELVRQLEYLSQFNVHSSIINAKAVGAFENSQDEILDTKDLEYIQSLTSKFNCATHLSPNCGYVFGCLAIKRHLSITAYGDVLPCPWIPITMGNIRTEPLAEIINRALQIKWFSYDNKFTCLAGNRDTYFYQNILPQAKDHPTDWRKIKWE
jgi:MoaA/NifB/PqqE/SkfB family radical SAM enzyme